MVELHAVSRPVGASSSRPLTFCMVTTFFPPYNFGGDGIFVYRLTNALARRGHSVHVVHDLDAFALLTDHEPKISYPLHPNVILHPLSTKGVGPLDLFASHQLGRPVLKRSELQALLNEPFDVIHFHNISLLGGPHVLRYGKALKLCTTHDHWFVCPLHVLWRFDREPCRQRTCLACTLHGRRPPQLWRYSGSVRRAVAEVDAFIAPSAFARESHQRNGFPAPMHVLPCFIPDAEVEQPAVAPPQHPRPYFLFAGRLEKIKGVQHVIEAFRTYNAADLLIAGTGTYEAELRAMAAGLPHVHFLGFLDHGRLRSLYAQALAVLVPSLCFETFGWVTLEAFANRAPVIVHDLGALPEVAAGGGLVYRTQDEMAQAMETLRTRPELRQQLGEAGYQSYRQNYSEARHMELYFALIEELQQARAHA